MASVPAEAVPTDATRHGRNGRRLIACPWPRGCFTTDVNFDGYASIGGERCACAAHRGAGRTYYLPAGPGRIASPVCPDLIYDRHNALARLLGVGDVQIIGGRRRGGDRERSRTGRRRETMTDRKTETRVTRPWNFSFRNSVTKWGRGVGTVARDGS